MKQQGNFSVLNSVWVTTNDDGCFLLRYWIFVQLMRCCLFFTELLWEVTPSSMNVWCINYFWTFSVGLVFLEPTYKPPKNISFINVMGLILKQNHFKPFEKDLFHRFNTKWPGNRSWIQIHSQMMMDDTNTKNILNAKDFKQKRKPLWYESEGKTLWRRKCFGLSEIEIALK